MNTHYLAVQPQPLQIPVEQVKTPPEVFLRNGENNDAQWRGKLNFPIIDWKREISLIIYYFIKTMEASTFQSGHYVLFGIISTLSAIIFIILLVTKIKIKKEKKRDKKRDLEGVCLTTRLEIIKLA